MNNYLCKCIGTVNEFNFENEWSNEIEQPLWKYSIQILKMLHAVFF